MLAGRTVKRGLRAFAGLCATAVVLGTSCGSDELQAIVAGLEAAAQSLDQQSHDDHMNFGEWLISEFDD